MLARMRKPAPLLVVLGIVVLGSGLGGSAAASAQSSSEWAATVWNRYQIAPNVVYLTASNYESKLDVYCRRGATTPQPTVVYFHGGVLDRGREGRLADVAHAVARDGLERRERRVPARARRARAGGGRGRACARCASSRLRPRPTTSTSIGSSSRGESAGGHLALASRHDSRERGLHEHGGCVRPTRRSRRSRPIINWYGITDVADMIDGPHKANLAVTWVGGLPNRDEIAKSVSPLTYVRCRFAADPDDSRRRGSDRAVYRPRAAAARGAHEGRRARTNCSRFRSGAHGNFSRKSARRRSRRSASSSRRTACPRRIRNSRR